MSKQSEVQLNIPDAIKVLLVEHMGGSIRFESEVSVGTTFYFGLPEYHLT